MNNDMSHEYTDLSYEYTDLSYEYTDLTMNIIVAMQSRCLDCSVFQFSPALRELIRQCFLLACPQFLSQGSKWLSGKSI